ncbi:hypothetical protein [Streptomyces sp. B6B3]|uniref:hypothetical protein n=1 Tax=Streptomyces sp. B6B3 TaxID=3153570 RepID=UPI00325CAF0C
MRRLGVGVLLSLRGCRPRAARGLVGVPFNGPAQLVEGDALADALRPLVAGPA